MATDAAEILRRRHARSELHGVLAVAGAGGSALASAAHAHAPDWRSKMLVSSVAAGDREPSVGVCDLTIMRSVVDVAAVNVISDQVLGNAAAAISGMARAYENRCAPATDPRPPTPARRHRPLVAVSMFGVTMPAVRRATERLEHHGYEVLVVHADGTGGRRLEKLAASRVLAGVLDVTTTELADDLVGGVLSAGPHRLEAAGCAGIPQIVSLGGLDMVNWGSYDAVPGRFRNRTLHRHNPTVTLMRTSPSEAAELGRRIATKLTAATGPTAVFVPLLGFSALDAPGAPFHAPEADGALIATLHRGLRRSQVARARTSVAYQRRPFATAAADELHELIQHTPHPRTPTEAPTKPHGQAPNDGAT
jgi:uncharacterized protein (UPF0261 family)